MEGDLPQGNTMDVGSSVLHGDSSVISGGEINSSGGDHNRMVMNQTINIHPVVHRDESNNSSSVLHQGQQNLRRNRTSSHTVSQEPSNGPEERIEEKSGNAIYERQLLPKNHGSPLWIPQPNIEGFLTHRRKGVIIGDLGTITPDGAFDVLFNICKPAGPPDNPDELPDNFEPLVLMGNDVRRFQNFTSGSYIASTSVNKLGGLTFRCSSSEGAVLTMPDGAFREDLRNISLFRDFAAENAESWYRFANGPCGWELGNGKLRLVTGCDKTTSWGLAAYHNVQSRSDSSDSSGEPLLTFRSTSELNDRVSRTTYRWEHEGMAEVKAGPELVVNEDMLDNGTRARNQCTFVRLYTIKLSEAEWARVQSTLVSALNTRRASKPAQPKSRSYFSTLTDSFSYLAGIFGNTGSATMTDSRNRSPVNHPSTFIANMLLQKHPNAKVAIVHDDDWGAAISENEDGMPTGTELWKRVQEAFNIVLDRQGTIYLSNRSSDKSEQSHSKVPSGNIMPSILKFLRDTTRTRDPSDRLFAAGLKAWKKYDETHESQYLKEAVLNHQAALDIRVLWHPGRPESLFHTAMALWAQCPPNAVTKENSSVVISYYKEALHLLLSGDKFGHQAIVYNNLGQVYFSLFRLGQQNPEAFHARSNLYKAIENHRSALKLRSARDDPNRPRSLINLSIALVQEGSEADLTHAITYLGEAVELCTAKASSRHSLLLSLNSLAAAYDSRYYYSGDINDVVGKVDALRKVLGLTDGGRARLIPLLNLTNALWRLCEIVPNRGNDLDEAVRSGQEALQLSDNSDRNTHAKVLITLANVLSARYAQSNAKNMMDLNQAIQYYRDAIDPDPENGPDPILCSSLASAISVCCQDFGEMEGVTLDDAISYNQDASHTCPKDDPLYLKIQNNLGSIYLTRFNKSGEEGDLIKGIQSYKDVVANCSAGDDDYTYYQNTLKEATRVLQDKRAGRTDKPLSITTEIRHTRSMTRTIHSRSSSGDSLSRPSTPESRQRESSFGPLTPVGLGPL